MKSTAIPRSCSIPKNAITKATTTSRVATIALNDANSMAAVQKNRPLLQARKVGLEMRPPRIVADRVSPRFPRLRLRSKAVASPAPSIVTAS
jgi:hypothetical protein